MSREVEMEPNLRDEQVKVIDTGQSSLPPNSTTVTASVPLELSAGEGFVNNEDGQGVLKVAILSESKNQEDLVKHNDDSSTTSLSSVPSHPGKKEDAQCSDSSESANCSDVSQEGNQKIVSTKPKIFIGMEDEDPREIGSSNDEDMDPLITVDDTESQISDLINFDTVSYDVMHQLGGEDEDDDDDEKSIATVSSLSCDLKMDSPLDHSQHSNSSSLLNLLDSSMKETADIGVCSSAQGLADVIEISASSCPSSPALHSLKTGSSVIDESISEACANSAPENKAGGDGLEEIDQRNVPSALLDIASQKNTENDGINENSTPEESATQDVRTESFASGDETVPDSTTAVIDEECVSESDLLPECDQRNDSTSQDASSKLEQCSEEDAPSSTLLVAESYQEILSDVPALSKKIDENAFNTVGGTTVSHERPSSPGSSLKNSVVVCLNEVVSVESDKENVEMDSPLQLLCEKGSVTSSDNSCNGAIPDISPGVPALSEEIDVDTCNSPVQCSLDEDVTSSDMSCFETKISDIPLTSNSNDGITPSSPAQKESGEETLSSSGKAMNENNLEIQLECSFDKACDLAIQLQVGDENVSSSTETSPHNISNIGSENADHITCVDKPCLNSPSQSILVPLPESSSSKDATLPPCKTGDDANTSVVSSSLGEEDKLQEEVILPSVPSSNNLDSTENNAPLALASTEALELDVSDAEAVKVDDLKHQEQGPTFEVSEPATILLSSASTECRPSNENAEVDSLNVNSTELSEVQGGLNEKLVETSEELNASQVSVVGDNPLDCAVSKTFCEGSIKDCISFQSNLGSDKNLESELGSEISANDLEVDRILESKDILSDGLSVDPCDQLITGEKTAQSTPLATDNVMKHPPSSLNLESSTLSSPDNIGGMNFSDFLSLLSPASLQKTTINKQYSVTALDEAQQTASYLVDDILQKAVLRVEEMLSSQTSICDSAVKTAQSIVSDILTEAVALSSDRNVVQLVAADERNDCNENSSTNVTTPQDFVNHIPEDSIESGIDSFNHYDDSKSLVISNFKEEEQSVASVSVASTPSETEVEQVESATESVTKEVFTLSSTSSEGEQGKSSADIANLPLQETFSNSQAEVLSKAESARSSPETVASDSARSSLLTCSDSMLRSEASFFVDGVLEEATKKYEESSSSESSPIKLKSLVLDSEYQDDEELATPCGEMLTEHFMDFESGRNVSVFCSIPESGTDDHLMAYDRVANTIGNREVDADTGKSLSVFRIEEDVFYEIQRASTCTSVFESVEEEDEDMIDTTIPVEDRELTSQTSISSSDSNTDNQNLPNEHFRTDNDAFEDAVGAFLTKERHTRSAINLSMSEENEDTVDQQLECSHIVRRNPCRALVLRHPEYDLSNLEEKKKMAEKWANGGECAVPDTPEMHAKQRAIREALESNEDAADVAVKLCQLALTEGGLINDELRKEAWPRMLGLDPSLEIDAPPLEDLKEHPEYGQVVLDVNRSLKRFPPDIPKDRRETLQDKLTRLIMYVISKHPHLRYYQGYHDVAVTFLLVVGESVAFQIMERLSTENLSDCMQPTMERTSYLLHFIYPLLHRLHPTLADYLERSEVGTMFCLPWFLTWFGHSLDRYQDVVRLYDHFLASPPLAPLYVAAVLVAHRADEVLAVDCDMAAIHALLSHIPDTLPLEILLRDATDLYMKFPPESIEREVEERFKNEQEMRVHEVEAREKLQRQRALRRRRGHSTGSGSWQLAEFQDRVGGTMMVLNRWMPPWVVQQQRLSVRLLFASATFFVGFYVYSRGGDMLPYL